MNSPEDEAEVQFDNRAIGRTIRSLRRKKGISQDVLSGLAGIARTHLTMIENGDKQANFETLWKLANALDMRPSELVAFIEHEIEQCSNSWEYVKIAAADSKKSQPLVHPVIRHTLHTHGSL